MLPDYKKPAYYHFLFFFFSLFVMMSRTLKRHLIIRIVIKVNRITAKHLAEMKEVKHFVEESLLD